MPLDELAQHRNDHPELYAENSKYAPKMTFEERCQALAAYKAGIVKQYIATTFGINVSTLGYIIQPHSKLYRKVRKEYEDLGHERFLAQYYTSSVRERIERATHDWKATIPAKDYDSVKQRFEPTGEPDPRARKMEGRHTMAWQSVGTVYIAIAYVDAPIPANTTPDVDTERAPGWYVYLDPKSPAYADWMHEGPFGLEEDRRTSTSAYEGFARLIGHEKGD
jgi:hypothetical protein